MLLLHFKVLIVEKLLKLMGIKVKKEMLCYLDQVNEKLIQMQPMNIADICQIFRQHQEDVPIP